MADNTQGYAQVNDRLKQIAELVEDQDMPLDEALGLFEEAVKLGMQASDLLEEDIAARDEAGETAEEAPDDPQKQNEDAL